jgi:hypothetical protein
MQIIQKAENSSFGMYANNDANELAIVSFHDFCFVLTKAGFCCQV